MKTPIVLIVAVCAVFTTLAWFGVGRAERSKKAKLEELNQLNHHSAILATLPPAIKDKLQLNNGKALVINVWATWCGPCINEIPELNVMVDEFGDKNVAFLAVTDEKEGDFIEWQVKPKNQDFQFKYVMEFENQPLLSHLRAIEYMNDGKAIPQHFLIDGEGKLVEVLVGGSSDNVKKIRTFLNNI